MARARLHSLDKTALAVSLGTDVDSVGFAALLGYRNLLNGEELFCWRILVRDDLDRQMACREIDDVDFVGEPFRPKV